MFFSKIIEKKFDAVLGRYDGTPAQYYFSQKDFPTIRSERFDVQGDSNVTLKGYLYYYNEINAEKIAVFDHGIGAGHLAYFKEIEMLAKHGYTVFSYDHTGCVDSGGKGILGFAQGINDLDRVLTALHKDARFSHSKIRVIGHSWGGYSAMNAAALHPEVSHVVSLAGFLSARALIEQYLPKMFLRYSGEVMERERQHNPRFADMDARDSMKQSQAKLFHIQSKDDEKVKYELCYEPLSEALRNRPDTTFVSVDHRGHDPHHTDAAVAANIKMLKDMEALTKKKQLKTSEQQKQFREAQDWQSITEQDPVIWSKIFEFLEK